MSRISHSLASACTKWAVIGALWALCVPLHAAAQEQVLLQEVMPELAGTPRGEITVAPAPAVGATLVVRASDVRRALAQAGLSAEGLHIPKATRISRKPESVRTDALLQAQDEAISEAAAPCSVERVSAPEHVRVAAGPRELSVEVKTPSRSGHTSGALIIKSAGRDVRVPLTLTVSCPEPVVHAGRQVRLVAVVGNVRVSAPGLARQDGRVGEVIRVENRATSASLHARVIDGDTLEVVP